MKVIRNLIIALIYSIVCLFSWQIGRMCSKREVIVEPQIQDVLPTIEEIQQRVGAQPDGKLGKETQKKWEAAINNKYANEYFKR